MTSDIVFLYVPCASADAARQMARILIGEKLAACANIIPAMESVYPWQGKIEQAAEALMIVKTAAALGPAASERLKALHGYDVPCIATLAVADVNPEYRAWLMGAIE